MTKIFKAEKLRQFKIYATIKYSPAEIRYFMKKALIILQQLFSFLALALKALFVASMIALIILSYPRVRMLLDEEQSSKIPALDVLNQDLLERGKVEMSKHKIVICAITRDNAVFFETMKKHLQAIGEEFADYRILLFENDSKDGAKDLLKKWSLDNAKVTIITKDFHNKKRPSIKFMAEARNHYLKELNTPKYKDFDMLRVVDMDMPYGFDLRGIRHSFSEIGRWDAVCSNGLNRGGRMYDAFAFRSKDFPYTQYEVGEEKYWQVIIPEMQQVIPATQDLMPVDSCFGGLAFYKRDKIKDCLYDSLQEDCEHVAFHKCIKDHGGKMFMNPAQMIHCNAYDLLKLMLYVSIVKTKEVWRDLMH
ncbi:MAG: hypothetical protein V4485_05210 [Pseudomonadota bacterium]